MYIWWGEGGEDDNGEDDIDNNLYNLNRIHNENSKTDSEVSRYQFQKHMCHYMDGNRISHSNQKAVELTLFLGYGASLGGPLCHTHNLTLRLFSRTCLHTMSDDDQTRPHKKHKQHDKQHHHGGGAAHPSSGVDLMNPRRPRGGQP